MKLIMKLLVLFLGVLMLANIANAESPREQLKQMVDRLQQSPSDDALREKIIKLARMVKPAPAISEDAKRYLARGIAAFESAKSDEDFKLAVPEFQNAANAAPWWPDSYFNLAKVQEKIGDLKGAIASYSLYLVADPNAKDAESIRTHSYKLEFMAEKKGKEDEAKAQAENDKKQRQAWAAEIVQWLQKNYGGLVKHIYRYDSNRWFTHPPEDGQRLQYSTTGKDMDQIQVDSHWCGMPVNSDVNSVKWGRCDGQPTKVLLNFFYSSDNHLPRVEQTCSDGNCLHLVYDLSP